MVADAAITNGDDMGTATTRGANGRSMVLWFSCFIRLALPFEAPLPRAFFTSKVSVDRALDTWIDDGTTPTVVCMFELET